MSEFETWWEENWKNICGSYFFSSEKRTAEFAWNAAKEKLQAELAEVKEELTRRNEGIDTYMKNIRPEISSLSGENKRLREALEKKQRHVDTLASELAKLTE